MTTPISAALLVVAETADAILAKVLQVAELASLPVSSWRAGDPTRTLFKSLAEITAERDAVQAEFAKGASMQTAEKDWATIRAKETFNVDRDEATFATPTVTVDNTGAGVFECEANSVVFSASGTGATYTNQNLVTIDALETGVEILLVAQQSGTAGSVGTDGVDTLVSPVLEGVEIVSSTASAGLDEESDEDLYDECQDTLGSFSPNGPSDAYAFVVKNSDLTGVLGITRAAASGDNSTGTVTVYAATDTAAIDNTTRDAIQAAVDTWATPLCTIATVTSGTPVSVSITASGVSAGFRAAVEAAWAEHMLTVSFAGTVYVRALEAVAFAAIVSNGGDPATTDVEVTVPALDTVLTAGQFPVVGVVTWL